MSSFLATQSKESVEIADLLADLSNRDIQIWAEGDRLQCSAPEGLLTSALRDLLAARKEAILAYLRQEDSPTHTRALPLQAVARGDDLPVSFAQQRMLFMEQLSPGQTTFNLPSAFLLKGPLNCDALEQSLAEIIRRHETLRTTLVWVEGQPVQQIAPARDFVLPIEECQGLTPTEREAEVQRCIRGLNDESFDVAHGPLFRVLLLRLAPEEHLLCFVLHHIIADGLSFIILWQELQLLYRAFGAGQPSPLAELPIQYADFAYWQRQWLQGEVLSRELAYWKQCLHGRLPVLQLPMARPRPALQTYPGAVKGFVLLATLLHKLKALSQQEGATLFMTLLAAFQLLLYRYSNQQDILVGTPVSNRSHLELEGIIGFFVNTLVIRTDFTGNPTFRELLARVRTRALEAYAHQELPFEKLVEELRPERSLDHSPLFQAMFILQVPQPTLALQGLETTRIQIAKTTAEFDLTLYMRTEVDGLYGGVEYNTDLFDEASMAALVGHLQTLLEGIVADPDRRVSELPLLTGAERQQQLSHWNHTEADYPRDQCLHHLFEEQVQRSPEAVAVVFEDHALTYQALNQRANQLAHHLQSLGVGPGSLVALCVERSLEMMVGLLGVLKAGAAYLPLDPAYPPERIAFVLQDAQVSILLTQQRLVDALPPTHAQVISLDADWEAVARQHDKRSWANPSSDVRSEGLAYVIYTSGSTGLPKGVRIVHRGVVNFLWSMRQQPGLTDKDVMLAVTTLSFDIAVLELFLPLITGARVVIVSHEVAGNSQQLAQALADNEATIMQATPATWRMLLEGGWPGRSALRILSGGEALPRELASQLLEKSAGLWNLYGPTETTIWSTVERVEAGTGAVSIGRPIANTQMYLLDTHLQPVPVGVIGDLYIGGDGLAQGYLNRPELTSERFIKNPFATDPDARMYKTGDVARYLPDGRIDFLGRSDHQVKLRGYRIELGEVEAVLEEHPGVRQAVAMVREDVEGDKRLVAYLTVATDASVSPSQLRQFVQRKLPNYMVPSHFVEMAAFPLTPNGKVDRLALPAPDGARPDLEVTYVSPQSSLEQRIAALWKDVLNVDKVGVHDNFFDLGGHSLLAVKLHQKLSQEFNIQLSIVSLFQYPTVRALAAHLDDPAKATPIHQQAQDRAKQQKAALAQRQQLLKRAGRIRE